MPSTTVHASAVARGDMWAGVSANTLLGATASLRIYDGTAPATADTALSGNNLLVTLPLAATPIASTTSGVATLGAIVSAAAALTGTASVWRILASDGTTCHYQGDVTSIATGTGSLLIATTSIVASATISCSAGSISLPA